MEKLLQNKTHKLLLIPVVLFFIIGLFQAFYTPILDDEAYYWLWSKKLDWGYFDHPPMVALWIKLGDLLFENELGTRLVTVVLNSFAVFLLGKICVVNDKKNLWLFGLMLCSFVGWQVFSFITTPDSPLLFFTVLYLWLLRRFQFKQTTLNAILLGICMALLMYSKYHGLLVIVFSLLPQSLKWLKTPNFYLAVAISLLLFSPHLNWIYQHNFSTFKYHFLERSQDESFEWLKVFIYMGFVVFGFSPLIFYFVWKAFFKQSGKQPFILSLKSIVVGTVLVFFFSAFKDNVQPQWLMIVFVALFPIVFSYYKTKPSNFLKILLVISGVLLLIARVDFIWPEYSPLEKNKFFAKNAAEYSEGIMVFEKYQEASIYAFYNRNDEVEVFRTIGNRKSQFSLWGSEENLEGKDFVYVSPWVKSLEYFEGFKHKKYYINTITDFHDVSQLEIEAKPIKESKNWVLYLHNTGNFDIKLNDKTALEYICFKDKQYNIIGEKQIPLQKEINLKPNEMMVIEVTVNVSNDDLPVTLVFGTKNGVLPVKFQSNFSKLE